LFRFPFRKLSLAIFALEECVLTSSTKQRLDELEESKNRLEEGILQEEIQKPLLTREQVTFLICRFREMDVTGQEQRQRLIDSFVNAVYLYEDKLVITFNYKDGTKSVSLTDVRGSDLARFGAPNQLRAESHRQNQRLALATLIT
jgi:hypothetical protein